MDTGLSAFLYIAREQGVSVNNKQIVKKYSDKDEPFGVKNIIKAAHSLELNAQYSSVDIEELNKLALPTIARAMDGKFFIITRLIDNNKKEIGSEEIESEDIEINNLADGEVRRFSREEFKKIWLGKLILIKKINYSKEKNKTIGFAWFARELINYRGLLLEIIAATILVHVFSILIPFFFQLSIDNILFHKAQSTVNTLAIGIVLFAVFQVFLSGFRQYLIGHTASKIGGVFGEYIYKHLLSLPLEYYEKDEAGKRINQLKELDKIKEIIGSTTTTIAIDYLFVILCLFVMSFYSLLLTLMVMCGIAIHIIFTLMINPYLRDHQSKKNEYADHNIINFLEIFKAITTIKSLAIEDKIEEKLQKQQSKYNSASFINQHGINISNQIASLINKILIVVVFWIGAQYVIDGDLSVGQLIAFMMLTVLVSSPFKNLVDHWKDYQQLNSSLETINQIILEPKIDECKPRSYREKKLKGEIEFESVHWSREENSNKAIDNVSFRVKPGEQIGIIGHSGCGKRTLTKLIQGLYIPNRGKVLIDGIDISKMNRHWLKRNLGVVLDDNYFFDTSIRNNLTISDPQLSMDRILEASKDAGAHSFIDRLPQGYDTVISDIAGELSYEERQKLALARAIINDPSILIYEHANRRLDFLAEQNMQENLAKVCKGRTVFIVSDEIGILNQCDRIFVLDKGRLIEQGSHKELLDKGAYYCNFYQYKTRKNYLRSVNALSENNNKKSLFEIKNSDASLLEYTSQSSTEVDETWALKLIEDEKKSRNRRLLR